MDLSLSTIFIKACSWSIIEGRMALYASGRLRVSQIEEPFRATIMSSVEAAGIRDLPREL
jgi:hypothetical protein